jgi:hypothetical protein
MSELQILAAHRVADAVLDVLHHARRFAVLSSPYLRSWPDLDRAVRRAVDHRVGVHLCVRSPDGTMRERRQQADEIAQFAALGVNVYEVPRLHAKLYANEGEAVLASMNLVSGSRNSIDLGVRIASTAMLQHLLQVLAANVPGLRAQLTRLQVARRSGFCVGCAQALPFDVRHPMCRACFSASKGGFLLHDLPMRCCHRCGTSALTRVHRPLCDSCAPTLPGARLAVLLGRHRLN